MRKQVSNLWKTPLKRLKTPEKRREVLKYHNIILYTLKMAILRSDEIRGMSDSEVDERLLQLKKELMKNNKNYTSEIENMINKTIEEIGMTGRD